jgi:O-antigen/teichoic acid export membrane protein
LLQRLGKTILIKSLITRIRNNPDYFGAVLTGYALMGLNILVQVFLVPLYLTYLGKYQFGVLMMLLSFINYASIGIGWMSGGALRVLGEYAAKGDNQGFAQSYSLSKSIYVGYALIIAIGMVTIGLNWEHLIFHNLPSAYRKAVHLSILAIAVYFVVLYDFSVERLALTAKRRQVAGNLFQMLNLLIFAISVVPWLLSGGSLVGVLICLVGGVVVARAASWIYWRCAEIKIGLCCSIKESIPLLKRLMGRMGLGYLLYGMLILTMQADTLIVGWLGGAEIAATFALVWQIANLAIQLLWKIPEYLLPYLIHIDTRGEKNRLQKVYREGLRWMLIVSFTAGLGYALLGHWVVKLWVGSENAPDNTLAYIFAGAAVFWLGSARLPAVFAYSTVKLKRLNIVAGIEVMGKLLLIFLLFPKLSYLAPLIAVNVVHIGGVALAYRRLL